MRPDDDMTITSPQNPRIKSVLRLQKKRERDRAGLITIEGVRELARALGAGVAIREIYLSPETAGAEADAIVGELRARSVPIFTVGRAAFAKIAYREDSGGLVAVAERPRTGFDRLSGSPDALFLVVDAVEKPGNLGALLRSADAVGVTGLIVASPGVDLFNPNAIRASLGAVFTVPLAAGAPEEAIAWLKGKGVRIVVTTPNAATRYSDANLTRSAAIVVGREDTGVSRPWIEAADLAISIPMRGAVDSLNVSAAAAILLYEALRQRDAIGYN
jgi:TrmH family RNA methyltransferase